MANLKYCVLVQKCESSGSRGFKTKYVLHGVNTSVLHESCRSKQAGKNIRSIKQYIWLQVIGCLHGQLSSNKIKYSLHGQNRQINTTENMHKVGMYKLP